MLYLPTEAGQGLVEYGLILVLIAVTVIAVLGTLSGQIDAIFTDIREQMEEANQ
jgi:pilus assembly protein Flp/PilA